jgi:hypothetical protein
MEELQKTLDAEVLAQKVQKEEELRLANEKRLEEERAATAATRKVTVFLFQSFLKFSIV